MIYWQSFAYYGPVEEILIWLRAKSILCFFKPVSGGASTLSTKVRIVFMLNHIIFQNISLISSFIICLAECSLSYNSNCYFLVLWRNSDHFWREVANNDIWLTCHGKQYFCKKWTDWRGRRWPCLGAWIRFNWPRSSDQVQRWSKQGRLKLPHFNWIQVVVGIP